MNLGKKYRKGKWIESGSSDDESDDEDMEIIEALLAKRATKGKLQYKRRIPLIFFACDEVDNIATKFPKKNGKDEKIFSKYKANRDY